MADKHTFSERSVTVTLCCVWLGILLGRSAICQATERDRQWTVYLAQDKHLDYNWCGSTTEIELRMAALLDYFLDAAERNEACWNLDGTLWDEVYRRHRGQAGSARLHNMIRRGRIGYAGNYAVLLWGILDTETAIRACYGAIPIEKSTGVLARTALVMENAGMTWGIAISWAGGFIRFEQRATITSEIHIRCSGGRHQTANESLCAGTSIKIQRAGVAMLRPIAWRPWQVRSGTPFNCSPSVIETLRMFSGNESVLFTKQSNVTRPTVRDTRFPAFYCWAQDGTTGRKRRISRDLSGSSMQSLMGPSRS